MHERSGEGRSGPDRGDACRVAVDVVDAAVAVVGVDPPTVEYVNPAYEELYGRAAAGVGEDPLSVVDAVHPDDRSQYEADVGQVLDAFDAGTPQDEYEAEYRFRHDDEVRWVQVRRIPLVEDGVSGRYVSVTEDVTERRRRDESYRQVFESVSDGLVVHDPDTGEILDANERYCALTGYSAEELVGEDISIVMTDDPEYSESAATRMIRAARDEGSQLFEWKGRRADGETFHAEVNLSVVEIRGRERVLASVRDITERKRRARVVRRLHESTDRLQDAETPEAVCRATFEAAREVLDLSMPACWLHDEDEGPALVPVAAPDAAWDAPGGPGRFEPGSPGYDVFERGEMDTYDPSARRDDTPLEHALLFPLGNHGVFGVAEPGVERYDDVVVDAATILAQHATTALDRAVRAAERRESERRMSAVLDRIDEAIFLTDGSRLLDADAGTVYVSAGYEAVFGLSYEALAADERLEFVDLVHPEDRSRYESTLRSVVDDASEDGDATAIDYRVQRPDGGVTWVHTDFYPLAWGDGDTRFVVVSRDITAEKEREETLETFHGATRELAESGSRSEASQVAVDAAESVLDFSDVTVHCYDEASGTLVPVASTGEPAERVDDIPSFGPGEGLPWQVFVDGEMVRASEFEGEDAASSPDLLLPLGPHGVMSIRDPDRTFDAASVELAQILAATLEGALNHVRGQHELERREAELREHRERAERLERLNTVIRNIEQATVEESTRDDIERAVCDQLTTVGSYQVAWIAEPNRTRDALVPRTRGGDGDGYVDTLAVDVADAGADPHPAAAAFTSAETHAVRGLATSAGQGTWRQPILRAGYQSLVSVPLVHGETVYGVLTLISDEPTAFDDRSEAVLTELGRSVGHALSVLERRRALESDTTTELEFSVDETELLFVRLADTVDAEVTLERTIRGQGGAFRAFYAVDDADPSVVADRAGAFGPVADVAIVTADESADACLLEMETRTWFGEPFADYGAVVREAVADADGATLAVETPRTADVRSLVNSFTAQYPAAELTAQRTRERSVRTLLELQDAVEEALTPRQRETLETAYSAGYFEWPRESTGEDVAELLDITQPTFNKHLRTVERKAFSMLLNGAKQT